MDNRPWSEIFRQGGEDWADKENAANILEETKTLLMAQRQAALGDIPVNRAEQTVKASKEWHDHVLKIAAARYEANKAKINLEYIKMKYGEWTSTEANARKEIGMAL